MTDGRTYDVIVVGAGNAALCAAIMAAQGGASVLVLERAPEESRGGNSTYTNGGFRMVHHGLPSIIKIVPDLAPELIANTDFGSYTREQFLEDLFRITQYNCDPDLGEVLVDSSFDTVHWLQQQGLRFEPLYGQYAFKHDGRFKFFGGSLCRVNGGGIALVEGEIKAALRQGVVIRYATQATALLRGHAGVEGVRVLADGEEEDLRAKGVVLACGGFEANREWRTRYLGPGWDMAKVRGSRYNTGDGIRMALDIGAQSYGQWSGCHASAWERNAPDFADMETIPQMYRQSYPYGLMINAEGKRFVDEGADFRGFTYAKYGRRILEQPGNYAWQVFDSQVTHLLRKEYHGKHVTKVEADTLQELAKRMGDVDAAQFFQTVREFNAAVKREVAFDPNEKDGRCTQGLLLDKSNWANALEKPPFVAYPVACSITFTFGGLKIDTAARVLDVEDRPIPGLYAAGELVGGIFYFNYPGASGLTSGAVFGRIAGREAAAYAKAGR